MEKELQYHERLQGTYSKYEVDVYPTRDVTLKGKRRTIMGRSR